MKIGYFLSCEEYGPAELVEQATLAERAGFEALWISDHFHPWNDEQGESPFVWSVIVKRHVAAFDEYVDAGFEEIYVANMGPHYREMIQTYGEQVLPAVRESVAA